MECLGGGGYVEESVLPRLYREAPLNSIWEGSGNVIALDVERAIRNAPESVDALFTELALSASGDHRLDAAVRALEAEIRQSALDPRNARRLTERIALLMQASLLVRHAPAAVSDAFCSLLANEAGHAFGCLTPSDPRSIIERAVVDG